MPAFPRGQRRRGALSAIAIASVVVAGFVVPAQADPSYPSKDDVNQSKQQAADTAAEIASLEKQLEQANDDLANAQVAEQVAAEAYDEASVELDEKNKAVAQADAAVAKAKKTAEDAKSGVSQLAADAYRTGGLNPGMATILDKDGAQDALSRYDTLTRLAAQRDKVFQKAKSDSSIADNLQKQADTAKRQQQQATDVKQKAAKAAAAASAASAAQVKTTADTRAGLITQLAQINHRTVQLETEYQAGVEAARQAAIEKAAKEKAEAEARAEAARRKAAAEKAAKEKAEAAERAREAAERQREKEKASRDNDRKPDDSAPPAAPTKPQNTEPPSKPSKPAKKPSKPASSPVGHKSAASVAIAFAKTKLGTPYLWGGTGPRYDCSGLTMRSWQAAGVNIPRTSRAQYVGLNKVSLGSMRAGDLIFYSSNGASGGIHHVTMYIGGGMMIEAPHTGANVRIVPVRYAGGIMPLVARP